MKPSVLLLLIGLFTLSCGKRDLSGQASNDEQLLHHWRPFEQQVERSIKSGSGIGAEVYIEKRGNVIYHQAFGFTDHERGVKSKVGDIYNIRSMTKPMGGAIIAMLMEQGKLSLSDRVAKYLPEFNHGKTKALTISQLLLHQGGYSQGQPGRSWQRYQSLAAMVDYWAENGPDSNIGGDFSYADAHADILGRIAEVITGKTARQLLNDWLIGPLEMEHSFSAWTEDPTLVKRIAPQIRGQKNNWRVVWRPSDYPWHQFGMFAQGVFATALDYAKFMHLFMPNRSIVHNEILSESSVLQAFKNRIEINIPVGVFPFGDNKRLAYGQLWGLALEDLKSDWPFSFMHQGSDGTAAYAFPKQEVIIIVLTQSRGGNLRNEVELAIQEHLLGILLTN